MSRSVRIPDRHEVDDTTPLRLDVAAAIAFPGGAMTGAGLRREAARNRLAVSRVAGKDWTTLRAIAEMIELCRAAPKAPTSSSNGQRRIPKAGSPGTHRGSSEMDDGKSARAAVLMRLDRLKNGLPPTSRKSTIQRARATVTPLKSGSTT